MQNHPASLAWRPIPLPQVAAAVMLWMCLTTTPTRGQVFQGQWARQSQQRIDQVRKTDVRVIVMSGDGQFARGATVKIEQLRHEFPIGLAISSRGWPDTPELYPVWRCFNAMSLSRLSSWPRLEPTPGQAAGQDDLQQALAQAQRQGLLVRWGGLISADPGRNPNWVARLDDQLLPIILAGRAWDVPRRFATRVDQFDIYSHSLDHDFVEKRLGMPMLRQLFEQAKAGAPRATICARFEDSLTGPRNIRMQQRIAQLQQAFIQPDMIAIEQRITGTLSPTMLARQLRWLDQSQSGVVICGLEVGGPSATGAGLNMEALLRLLFGHANIKGIWFGGLYVDQMMDPNAALLKNDGQPTPVGMAVENLFGKLWWTREELTTDELGNAYSRVFAGNHRISATLADGTKLQTTVWLPVQKEERVILLQPLEVKRGQGVKGPRGQ